MALAPPQETKPTGEAETSDEWVNVSQYVNVRASPSPDAETIRVAQKGERLRATGRQGNWVQVEDPNTAVVGWIYARFVESPSPESPEP
jgi:hypothetical protein